METVSAVLLTITLCQGFQLSIVHFNDLHARFEETNAAGGLCKSTNSCIGGFSRLKKAIDEVLEEKPDSIVLSAGDNFQGTLWYNTFRWNVTQYFLNKIPFDAITLGNHDLDDGVGGVVPYIESLKSPVIVSNIDDRLEPSIQGIYNKSIVIVRSGRKIGVIGVITTKTPAISHPGSLKFLDESESVNEEAERLVRDEGVFTNIVLSHSGHEIEKEIGRKATAAGKIGLIVGGHTHSLLYTRLYDDDTPPIPDEVIDPYPTIVNRADDGKPVLVVQTAPFARYLGNISVMYDDDGNVINGLGYPIFLNSPQDEEINAEILLWKQGIGRSSEVVGETLTSLNLTACTLSECPLGNFVADAYASNWSAPLALLSTANLRSAIEKGNITYGDIAALHPFGDTIDLGEIQGKYIKDLFELAACRAEEPDCRNIYMQVSGFMVVYNQTRPVGTRVQSIKTLCDGCISSHYEYLDLDKTYRLVVVKFMRERPDADGFSILRDNLKNLKRGKLDINVLIDYLAKNSPINPRVEERLRSVS